MVQDWARKPEDENKLFNNEAGRTTAISGEKSRRLMFRRTGERDKRDKNPSHREGKLIRSSIIVSHFASSRCRELRGIVVDSGKVPGVGGKPG
ncbi:unnamed protein product [Lasius platythorax]|uniref:Uncharacterized protein n=1 Tax=Lasius platythorax TaxID=488582 RepID=A0AAV2NU48_9HYME